MIWHPIFILSFTLLVFKTLPVWPTLDLRPSLAHRILSCITRSEILLQIIGLRWNTFDVLWNNQMSCPDHLALIPLYPSLSCDMAAIYIKPVYLWHIPAASACLYLSSFASSFEQLACFHPILVKFVKNMTKHPNLLISSLSQYQYPTKVKFFIIFSVIWCDPLIMPHHQLFSIAFPTPWCHQSLRQCCLHAAAPELSH